MRARGAHEPSPRSALRARHRRLRPRELGRALLQPRPPDIESPGAYDSAQRYQPRSPARAREMTARGATRQLRIVFDAGMPTARWGPLFHVFRLEHPDLRLEWQPTGFPIRGHSLLEGAAQWTSFWTLDEQRGGPATPTTRSSTPSSTSSPPGRATAGEPVPGPNGQTRLHQRVRASACTVPPKTRRI